MSRVQDTTERGKRPVPPHEVTVSPNRVIRDCQVKETMARQSSGGWIRVCTVPLLFNTMRVTAGSLSKEPFDSTQVCFNWPSLRTRASSGADERTIRGRDKVSEPIIY